MARVLIDECLDRRLAGFLTGHDAETVYSRRWSGTPDRLLLDRIEGQFDVFVTADQSLVHQQNLGRYSFSIVVLKPRRNRLPDLIELLPTLLSTLEELPQGAVLEIAPG